MNVLIAIISESFSEAVTNSERIFYGARIDLLHQLGNGVKALNRICPIWVQQWMKQNMDVEELKEELTDIVVEAIKGPIHYSEKSGKRNRYSDLAKRLRDEVRRSASHTVRDVKQVQDLSFADMKEDIKELRGLIEEMRSQQRGGGGGRGASRRELPAPINRATAGGGVGVIEQQQTPLSMLSPWSIRR